MALPSVRPLDADLQALVGQKLIVPTATWDNPSEIFVDGFAIGHIVNYNQRRKFPFQVIFKDEKKIAHQGFFFGPLVRS